MEGRQNLRNYFGQPVSPPAHCDGIRKVPGHRVEDGGAFICIAPSVSARPPSRSSTVGPRQADKSALAPSRSCWAHRTVMGLLGPDKSLILVWSGTSLFSCLRSTHFAASEPIISPFPVNHETGWELHFPCQGCGSSRACNHLRAVHRRQQRLPCLVEWCPWTPTSWVPRPCHSSLTGRTTRAWESLVVAGA